MTDIISKLISEFHEWLSSI